MTPSRFVVGIAATGMLALAACNPAPSQPQTAQPVPGPQPTNVGGSAAAPVVPGTARIMGGTGNADIQRVPAGQGAQAPIVPGTGRITGGLGNAEVQRSATGSGVQAPIVRGTGQITGGLGNAEVQRQGGGPPPR